MMSFASMKDTFYLTVRDRIAATNPGRTLVLRGTLRPAVLVAENELPTADPAHDRFTLEWLTPRTDGPLLGLACAIHYSSAGSAANAGMDRGRALAAMDAELLAALSASPQSAAAFVLTTTDTGTTQTPTGTRIFWSDAIFSIPASKDGELARTATVEVFGYA